MATPRPESDPVAARLAQAAERLKAQRAPGEAAAPALTADEALVLLKTLCTELRIGWTTPIVGSADASSDGFVE